MLPSNGLQRPRNQGARALDAQRRHVEFIEQPAGQPGRRDVSRERGRWIRGAGVSRAAFGPFEPCLSMNHDRELLAPDRVPALTRARTVEASLPFRYGVYGIELLSDVVLSLPACADGAAARIELREGGPELFAQAISGAALIKRADWYTYGNLPGGASYVRWRDLGEFLVSTDGGRIWWRRAPGAHHESFQVYLLGQALSFALVKGGLEPLHGTAIVHEGQAIALVGDSGYGKSTLAAGFLGAGCTLLTDDLLLLRPVANGLQAQPGPARLKLLPDSAQRTLGAAATGVPMNPETQKHVIALERQHRCEMAVPLRAIYVLVPPEETRRLRRMRATPLVGRDAFTALVGNTFNRYLDDAARMQRQLVQTAAVIRAVPVRRLAHPRSFDRLGEVVDAILVDSELATGVLA